MLQTIWRQLPLFDLIRCQQVCQKWAAYLPGNDQALHQALFSLGACQMFPDDRPCWTVYLNVRQYHEQSFRSILPRLKFSLDVTVPAWEGRSYLEEDDKDRTYHPMMLAPANYSTLIHPRFDSGLGHNKLEFDKTEDLEVLLERPVKTGERWEQMLACVPAVQKMDVHLWWRRGIEPDETNWAGGPREVIPVKNDVGVTVWDLVEVVRNALGNAETELASC